MVTTIFLFLGLLSTINPLEDSSKYITISIHTSRVESPAIYVERHAYLTSLQEDLKIGSGQALEGDLNTFDTDQYYLFKVELHKTLKTRNISKTLSIGILRYTTKGWKILEIDSAEDSEYDFSYVLAKE